MGKGKSIFFWVVAAITLMQTLHKWMTYDWLDVVFMVALTVAFGKLAYDSR